MKVGRVVYPRTRLTVQKLLIKSAPLNQQLSQNQKIQNHVDQKVFSLIILAYFVKIKLILIFLPLLINMTSINYFRVSFSFKL